MRSVEHRRALSLSLRRYEKGVPACLKDEVWKEVPDWPGFFASSLGRIRDEVGILQKTDNGKHAFIRLWHPDRMRDCTAATIVLLSFVGYPPDKEHNLARHLDDNPTNDILENLAWGSKSDNHWDARRNGRIIYSLEWRDSISRAKKGKWIGGRADNHGRIHINNGIKERHIKADENIPEGWSIGQLWSTIEKRRISRWGR
jgi:hypothetical protein